MASRVKVDRETGGIEVKDIIVAHDCGQPINPLGVRGQVEGSILIGMGWGLCEEQPTDNGLILNPSFADYKIIRTRDMPQIELHEVLTHDPEGPYGAKESAEGAVAPTPASIANAIYHATGAEFGSNVLKPEKVWKAIREAEEKEKKVSKR